MLRTTTLLILFALFCYPIQGNNGLELTGITIHNCPGNIQLTAQPGQNGAYATWQIPTASTTCQISSGPDCSGISNNINGFIYMGQYNGSKYFCSSTNDYSWNTAKNIAQNNGGHLATVSSSGENTYLANNIIAHTAWLGLTDAANEGNFVWHNGEAVTYTNWDYDEPNNYNNSDYAVILKDSRKWRDRRGSDHYEFVMEKDCPVTQEQGNVTISRTSGPDSGSFFPIGSTTVVYTAVDECGESRTCSFVVTVNPSAPCAGQGGDNDGDGVCANQDCNDNNPNVPTSPGTSCNDGNPNTNNDVIQSDGCTCAGTPIGPNCDTEISISTGPGTITVSGLGAAPVSSLQVFNSSWGTEFQCAGNCNNTETVNVASGTYYVYAKYYTASWQLICEKNVTLTVSGGDPCAGQGGDNDGDGVCANQDCNDFNPNVPAAPGTPCNDGNPNTGNDVIQGDGCTCAGTPIDPCAGQGGDYDGDGVCANQDCNDFNPNVPTAPGTPCNDGDPSTTGDVIQGDGCTCAGTPTGGPNCDTDITITTEPGKIKVAGLDGAPVSSLQIFNSNWGTEFHCAGNCNAMEMVNVSSGTYYVFVKYYTANWQLICERNVTLTVTGGDPCAGQGGDYDGDGVCANQDCNDFNPNVPAAPGTPCNDGNPNTGNDVIQGDGCTCAGTPINPCAGQGGDNDGDGVCANQDCNDFNPNIPAAPGTSCNDGNPNTSGDVIQGDGCTCAGTPTGPNCDTEISITTGPGTITVSGLGAAPVSSVHVFNAAWQTEFQCGGNCNNTETINVSNGTYIVIARYYDAGWNQICEKNVTVTVTGGDPCAAQGGDSDGDGVCDNQDNCKFTANPDQADSDGDGEGDVCDQSIDCNQVTLVKWDLNACYSNSGNNSPRDFSELTPAYPNSSNCIDVSASTVYREEGSHSCTPGFDGNEAMCIGTRSNCNFIDDDPYALRFSVTINPEDAGRLSALTFYENAPTHYNWGGGATGNNNYPTKYGIRILKNGQQVFKQTGINTTQDWTLESFDFSNDPDFEITGTTTFTFEMRAYCRVGNGANVSVWDIDHIKIKGCCTDNPQYQQKDIFAFTAEKSAQQVDLFWTINTDNITSTYIIERSTDGINFEAIQESLSLYNSTQAVYYEGQDHNPSAGTNYYRIKQQFDDGQYRYSDLQEVTFDEKPDRLLVFPNPASDQIYTSLKDYAGQAARIQIYNSLGVLMQEVQVDALPTDAIALPLGGYEAGMYALTIKVDGHKQVSKLFVIARL